MVVDQTDCQQLRLRVGQKRQNLPKSADLAEWFKAVGK